MEDLGSNLGVKMSYKIEFNKDDCVGCGVCTMCENWKMGEDGKAHPVKTELDEIGCNQDAVDICPAGIIKIIEL